MKVLNQGQREILYNLEGVGDSSFIQLINVGGPYNNFIYSMIKLNAYLSRTQIVIYIDLSAALYEAQLTNSEARCQWYKRQQSYKKHDFLF